MIYNNLDGSLNFTIVAEFANDTIEVFINDSVVIDCCIEAPVVQYQWYKDGIEILSSSDIAGIRSKILFAPILKIADYGLYTCLAGKTDEVILYHVLVIEKGINNEIRIRSN